MISILYLRPCDKVEIIKKANVLSKRHNNIGFFIKDKKIKNFKKKIILLN